MGNANVTPNAHAAAWIDKQQPDGQRPMRWSPERRIGAGPGLRPGRLWRCLCDGGESAAGSDSRSSTTAGRAGAVRGLRQPAVPVVQQRWIRRLGAYAGVIAGLPDELDRDAVRELLLTGSCDMAGTVAGFTNISIVPGSVSATLAGGSSPTGTVTFVVFGPQAAPPSSCESGGTTLGTASVTANGPYQPSASFTPTAAGTTGGTRTTAATPTTARPTPSAARRWPRRS